MKLPALFRQNLHKSKRFTLLRLAGTLLGLGLLIYLLAQQGWGEVWMALRQISLWRFLLAAGLILISRLAVSGRWYTLLRSAGVPVSSRQALRITFAGLFASNFLPTTVGGDVIRLAGGVQLRWEAAVVTASLLADRLIGMAGMALALPLGLGPLLAWFKAGGETGSGVQSFRLVQGWAFSGSAAGWWGQIRIQGRKFLQALGLWLRSPQALLPALGYSLVHTACIFGMLAILLAGMGERISFWLVCGLYSAVYFITLLPISINGLGVQEVAMSVLFTQVGGVSPAAGLTLAVLYRTLHMLASLPGFLFVPDILGSAGPSRSTPDS